MQLNKQIAIPVIIFTTTVTLLFMPAIPQDIHYHNFSDQRTFLGIVNCLNVISNIPYLIIGLVGIYKLFTQSSLVITETVRHVYITFFSGVALVGLGSAYYHLHPSNDSLLWDRLPMAIAFMAFFTIVVAEYINEVLARRMFMPLLMAGVASVLYWYWTESIQQGDLRFYILVQFLPVLLLPVILLLHTHRYTHSYFYWLIIGCYVLAKLLESGDEQVYAVLGYVSGHSLKHLASALAPLLFYVYLLRRQQV